MRGSATSTPIKVGRGWLMTRANTANTETRPETMTLQNLDVSGRYWDGQFQATLETIWKYLLLSINCTQFKMPKNRNNYKTQTEKSMLSSSTESEESGAENQRQIYYRSPTPTRSATPTPTVTPDRKGSTSQHNKRSSDRHPRSPPPVPYRPPPPSYERHPRSPPPVSYRPPPPSYERHPRSPPPVAYERDHHHRPRHHDDGHKKKILPRYDGWSGSNPIIKRRSAKEFSIHSTKRDKSVLIIGEKQKNVNRYHPSPAQATGLKMGDQDRDS